jgi:hypothetical protein
LEYLGLAGVSTNITNIRKYEQILRNLPLDLKKLNISYNVVLPLAIKDVVLF